MIRHCISATVLLLCGAAASQAKIAATINVTTPLDVVGDPGECSLREAIENVNVGGKTGINNCAAGAVFVNNETTQVNLNGLTVMLDDEVSLRANHAAVNGGTIDGQSFSRIFRVTHDGTRLTLAHATLQGGVSSGSGGAILVEDGAHLDTNGVLFQDCHAASQGGAISADGGGFVDIEFAAFYKNSAGQRGGALYAGGEELNIRNSKLFGNYSGKSGGAIQNQYSNMHILDSRIEGNYVEEDPDMPSDGYGGGIYSAGHLWLRRVNVEGNYVDHGNGGGMYIESSQYDVDLEDVRFDNNVAGKKSASDEAGNDGGGIYSDGSFVTDGVTFSNNKASLGGAIAISGAATNADIKLINTSFLFNQALHQGGALWVTSTPTLFQDDPNDPLGAKYGLKILNSTFSQNFGDSQIHLEYGQPAKDTILFVNNIVNAVTITGCTGYVERLATKRLNDATSTTFNTQWPGTSCGIGIPAVAGAASSGFNGWYFHTDYALTLLKDAGDAVVCTYVGSRDQFGNPRQCRLGAVEKEPSKVVDPPIYSP